MLRINEVIDELKGIRSDLKSLDNGSQIKKSNEEIKTSEKERFVKKAEHLKEKLEDDEMIIAGKKNKELRIIKKSKYESDKKNKLDNKYIVIDKNLK